MATTKEFLAEILDRLSGLDGVTHRPMMGEYILYYNGKIIGGIYDNRLLVKPVKAAISCLPDAPYEFPYDGAKPMLRVTKPTMPPSCRSCCVPCMTNFRHRNPRRKSNKE